MKWEKPYQRNVGGAWNKTSKKDGKTTYKWVVINLKELSEQGADLNADELGMFMFRQYDKRKETHPDYQFMLPTETEVYSPGEKKYVKPVQNKKEIGESQEDLELFEESSEIPF